MAKLVDVLDRSGSVSKPDKSITYVFCFLAVLLSAVYVSVCLQANGANVCRYTERVATYVRERYTSHCHLFGWGRCTHYRSRTVYKIVNRYRCCGGWKSTDSSNCRVALCNGNWGDSGCSYHGQCVSPNNCKCNKGYYGKQCDKCPSIAHCSQVVCSTPTNGYCETCQNEKSDAVHSLFWPIRTRHECAATCSWNHHWCWPGDCSGIGNLASSCACRSGFVKKAHGVDYTKCDLVAKPDLETCHLGISAPGHDPRNSTSGKVTGCQYETDTYFNFQPQSLYFTFLAKFMNKVNLKINHNYIDASNNVGIVDGSVIILKKPMSGSRTTLDTIHLRGGGDCRDNIGDSSPSAHMDCSQSLPVNSRLKDGDRLCTTLSATSGGFFNYNDFNHVHRGTEIFTRQTEQKLLCFRYDGTKPMHCSLLPSGHCNEDPVVLGNRITTTGILVVRSKGWSDPIPHGGTSDHASGVSKISLQVAEMQKVGNELHVNDKASVVTRTFNNTLNFTVNLTNQPALYVIIVETHDVAGNVRKARRFAVYDKSSRILSRNNKPFRVVSASKDTNYKWQTHHGPICLDWRDRFINDYDINNNRLLPIKPDREVVGIYEQLTGVLPIKGTPNVNGIIDFKYSWSINNGSRTAMTSVPNFLNQSLCLTPKLSDGDTYTVVIQAEDIIANRKEESLIVYIDSSVPDVTNMWLVKGTNKQVYVHDSANLAKMVLEFDAMDPHSGLLSVEWALGTAFAGRDIGSGVLAVERTQNLTPCPHASSCYCPAVGQCEFYNYTLSLNKLQTNHSSSSQHNQAFYFTITTTNAAHLKTFDHLDILVDTSPPEAGSVKEGSVDGPDIDFTSDDSLLVHWDGFIDHDSGIHHYLVGIAPHCLTVKELEKGGLNQSIILETKSTSSRLSIQTEGLYYTTVVAYNNAFSPSKPSCSDGITRDTTAPEIQNVIVRNARIAQHLVCDDKRAWIISENLTMVEINSTTQCQARCKNVSNSVLVPLLERRKTVENDIEIVDSFCMRLPYMDDRTIIYLPSDAVKMNWNCSEGESQMRDFQIGFGTDVTDSADPDLLAYQSTKGKEWYKIHHLGFASKTPFYIFIKAINKAGLTNAVSYGPVMIDDTPPVFSGRIQPVINGNFVGVHWTNTTFSDPEQPDQTFTVMYRIGHDDKHVTPILQTPKHVRADCSKHGYSGCARYPLKRLQNLDSELSLKFFFDIYVYNSAGHFTVVRTESIQLPSLFPPGRGIVLDVDPNDQDRISDIDFHVALKMTCVRWKGFSHHRQVSFQIGIGSNKTLTDVLSYMPNNGTNVFCITSEHLKPYMKYFATVKAVCSGGETVVSSDGFVIVDKAGPSNYLAVFDGKGCDLDPIETVHYTGPTFSSNVTRKFNLKNLLHIGETYTLEILMEKDTPYKIYSPDVTWNQTTYPSTVLHLTSFKALNEKPLFQITDTHDKVLFVEAKIRVFHCSIDIDFQISRTNVGLNWLMLGPWKNFTTHFEVEVNEVTCDNNTNSCLGLVAKGQQDKLKTAKYFGDVNLVSGQSYKSSVSPCFEHICLRRHFSNGMKVVTENPNIGTITGRMTKLNSTCQNVFISVGPIKCMESNSGEPDAIVQWALSAEDRASDLITPWKTTKLENRQIHDCVDPISITANVLFSCVRVICPSGLSDFICSTLDRKKRQSIKESNAVFELDARDESTIKNLLSLKKYKELSEKDVDFTSSNIKIVGVLKHSHERNITWFLMTEKRLPISSCKSDDKCVLSIKGLGEYAYFDATFKDAHKYFICVSSSGFMRKDKSTDTHLDVITVCGDGFIIDDRGPETGQVEILNAQKGFVVDTSYLSIAWNGFSDVEIYFTEPNLSGIASYSYAVGSHPHGQDVIPFTNVGLHNNAHVQNISLEGGQTYFATVKAEDRVGHVSFGVSEGVVVDVTPPNAGVIQVGGVLTDSFIISSTSISVHWQGFDDPESGIESTLLAVGSSEENQDVLPFTKCESEFAEIADNDAFVDGHQYYVKLQVINRAGLSVIKKSKPFTVDSSPPDVGVVRDGLEIDQHEADYQTTTDTYWCYWSGFNDKHSGLAYYRVGLGMEPYQYDVEPMVNVGLTRSMSWSRPFSLGTKYFATVEACNHAGLCSQAVSDGVIMDDSPPVKGLVTVGHDGYHHKYHGHTSTLSLRWVGFEDPETGIHHFDWCIGRISESCDILPFTNNLLSDSVIKTGLFLPVSIPLYISVRAFNPVGLFSIATSDSFVVDNIPPTIVSLPSFFTPVTNSLLKTQVQWDNSILDLSWKFGDKESPIERHFVSLSTHDESQTALESVRLGAEDHVTIVHNKDSLMMSGDHYKATITACNSAGLCSTAASSELLIDSSPPSLGGFTRKLNWDTFNDNRVYKTILNLTWTGFVDSESGIHRYFIGASRTFDESELSGGRKEFVHTGGDDDQKVSFVLTGMINVGENLILSISAENNAGLSSDISKMTVTVVATDPQHQHGILEIQRHSCDVQYCTGDCTCAAVGKTCVRMNTTQCIEKNNTGNKMEYPDVEVFVGFGSIQQRVTASSSCLRGYWQVHPQSHEGKIRRFEWSMGMANEEIGYGVFDKKTEKIWHSVGKQKQIIHCLAEGRFLKHNAAYIISIRAWYSFSIYRIFKSNPVKIDHTPPSLKHGKFILDSDASCLNDIEYIHGNQSISACWTGVFQDQQSPISSYKFWMGSTPEGGDIIQPQVVGLVTNYSVSSSRLIPGTKYYFTVRASNEAGLHTTLSSDGFVIDTEPPIAGVVFNTDRHKNRKAQSSNTTIGVSWHGFEDYHSYVQHYEISLVEAGDKSKSLLMKDTAMANSIVLHHLNLEHGKLYHILVKAADAAGFISKHAQSPDLLVDTTPPSAFVCDAFRTIAASVTFAMENKNMNLYGKTEMHFTENLQKTGFYKIVVVGDVVVSETNIVLTVGPLKVNGRFKEMVNGMPQAQHSFLSPNKGQTNITITLDGKGMPSRPVVKFQECQTVSDDNGPHTVMVEQLRPDLMSVCARIRDKDSGLKNVWIGAGTTKGGYQIKALSPTAITNHQLIQAELPHGSPVFVSVLAENNAGLRAHFSSDAIIIDHTPPNISYLVASLKYGTDIVRAAVDIEGYWNVTDPETSVTSCFCAVGNKPLSTSVRTWETATPANSCTLRNIHTSHGIILFITVRCLNKVHLESSLSSDPIQVEMRPPTVTTGTIQFITGSTDSVQASRGTIQSEKQSLEFFWTGFQRGESIESYYYRVTDGAIPLTNWVATGDKNYARIEGLQLQDGHVYEVQVRATNHRLQYSAVLNGSVTVDSRTPTLTGSLPKVNLTETEVTLSWENVFDTFGRHAIYTVSAGSRQGNTDISNQEITRLSHLKLNLSPNQAGIYVVVEAKIGTGKTVTFSGFITTT